MTFEPWISSFKHGNESWAEFSLPPSQHLQWDTGCTCRAEKGTFNFLKQSRQKGAIEAGQNVHWSYTFWLISPLCLLCFLLQPSLFVLNFHWDQQKVSYHILLFVNSKLRMFKHFPLNVYSDCGKAGSSGNFSKIASAVWRNNTEGRSRYEVI